MIRMILFCLMLPMVLLANDDCVDHNTFILSA